MGTVIKGKTMIWAMGIDEYHCITRDICPVCGRNHWRVTDYGELTIFPGTMYNTEFELALDLACPTCEQKAELFVDKNYLIDLCVQGELYEYESIVRVCCAIYDFITNQDNGLAV